MKLFSWARKKPFPSTAPLNHQHNADNLFGISRSDLSCAGDGGIEATASRLSTHGQVLTIGTLGMGSLLNREEEEEEEEDDEDDDDNEDGVHMMCCMADLATPNPQSLSSNRASTSSNRASTSSYRASVSSNRESVSSVDIQKLQDELQKILYFKLGQEHEDGGKKSKAASKAKGKKQKKQRLSNAEGKSHVPSERGSMRGAMPLHSFLEMPMDQLGCKKPTARPPHKFLSNTQYLLLMQSLKSKFLHCTAPTRVNFSTSLFEKLVRPKINRDLQHGSTMDKMLHLLRKIMNKRPYRRSDNGQEKYACEEDSKKCIENVEEEEIKEEEQVEAQRMKLALARSFRESDKFISYIASIIEQLERSAQSSASQENHCHHPCQLSREESSHPQSLPATSSSLDNECWIKTDDEYFVLEL